MKDCLFCKIYKEKKGVVWENKFFYSRFDKFPISPGHLEVIPKRHISSILLLDNLEEEVFKSALSNSIEMIKKTNLKQLYKGMLIKPLNEKSKWFCEQMLRHVGLDKIAEGYNIGINEGPVAGQTIPHLHIHIIPRYLGDVVNPIGGVRNIIPGMGNYK